MIANGILNIIGQVVGIFGQTGKAKQEALKQVAANMQRTWTDEIIVAYWFAPSVLALFGYPDALTTMQGFAQSGDLLFEMQVGISAAVFGLGKLAGKG